MKKVSGNPTRKEILERLFKLWQAPEMTESIPTRDSIGRILAKDAIANVDKPVFRASAMDGVGVRSKDFANGIPNARNWWLGADYCRADTGDDFPDEFDSVVQIEDVTILPSGGLEFHSDMEGPITAGFNVTSKGSSVSKGEIIGLKGTKILPMDLAALSMGAVTNVTVYKRPKVAFIPTGSELVTLGETPERGQCVDSNSLMAKAMLEDMGAEPIIYPIIRDDKAELTAAFDKAFREADIVVLNAGTSKGSEDYCHMLLEERGTMVAHGVAAAPGKPIGLAIIDGKPVINVGGPPVACWNGLDWCVRVVVNAYFEQSPPKRNTVKATLTDSIKSGAGFESIVRIILKQTPNGEYMATPLHHRTTRTTTSLNANGLYVTRLIPEPQEKGDIIEVELLR